MVGPSRRRLVVAVATVVWAGLAEAVAPAFAAAQLQDFDLASRSGRAAAVARGLLVNGLGTFVSTGPTSETLTFPGVEPVHLTRTPGSRTTRTDPYRCTIAVSEKGTFEFDQFVPPDITQGGSGPYTLNAVLAGRWQHGSCDLSSPRLQSLSLAARSVEIHAVA